MKVQIAWFACLAGLLSAPAEASREKPRLFYGNASFSERQLLDHLREREAGLAGASVSLIGRGRGGGEEALARTERLLRQFYHDHGYPLAKVRRVVNPPDFSFHIDEGPRAEMGLVEFEGNRAVGADTLARLLQLKGPLDSNLLEEGLQAIRAHYRDCGYLEAEVGEPSVEVVEIDETDHFPVPFREVARNRVRLLVPIVEGPRYSYGSVTASPEVRQLRDFFPIPGAVCRESELLGLRDRIYRHFLEKDALVKELQILQKRRRDAAKVDLEIVGRTFPPLTLKRIEFRGNRRYPDGFYRRELAVAEERTLSPLKIEQSVRKLLETGALVSMTGDDVELTVREDLLEADLTFHLHERDRQKIQFSLGPDGLGGLEAGLFYSALNFLGLGERLGLDLKVGSSSSELAIGLASRYLLGTRIPASMALRFFRRNTRFELPGAEDRLRTLFSSSARGFLAGGQYRIRRDETARVEFAAERVSGPVRADHFSLTPGWRKTGIGPAGGQTLELSSRFSLFEGDADSWNLRWDAELSGGAPADSDSRGFAYRIHAAHARFFGADPEPLFERILKRESELRGFSFLAGPWAEIGGELTPIGGDALLTAGGEYRLPLTESAALVPFFDTGINFASAAPAGAELAASANRVWRASLGAEIRLRPFRRLPAARLILAWNPLRLDRTLNVSKGLVRLRDPALSFQVGLR